MPEGPECRRFAEALAQRVSSKTLKSIEIVSGRYEQKLPSGFDQIKKSLPIEVIGAGVHGKFIYWMLKDEYSIWSTLGMTGQWSSEATKHTRVKFVLNNGSVYFNDQRNFGTLKFVRGKYQLLEKLKSLGPDMLANDVDDDLFVERVSKYPEKEIVKVMMDQSVISGVGNYIKSDSLWLSQISPHRTVMTLSYAEMCALNRSIKFIMRESFQNGGATISTYKNFDGSSGEYNQKFLVYNQKSDPDGNEVIRDLTADNRTTHWVPAVQK